MHKERMEFRIDMVDGQQHCQRVQPVKEAVQALVTYLRVPQRGSTPTGRQQMSGRSD
jgi:hypothetical protein